MNTYNATPAWSRAESQLDAVLARFDIPASFSIQARMKRQNKPRCESFGRSVVSKAL